MFPIELHILITLSSRDSSGPTLIPVMLVGAHFPIVIQNAHKQTQNYELKSFATLSNQYYTYINKIPEIILERQRAIAMNT